MSLRSVAPRTPSISKRKYRLCKDETILLTSYKDRSFKKPTLSSSSTPDSSTKPDDELDKHQENGSNGEKKTNDEKKEPLKFMTWNANSFLLRVKNNWSEFTKFVEKVGPDIIALQEVRMPVAGSKGSLENPRELKDDTSSS